MEKHTHTHTHTHIYKYSSTTSVKAGDKHRVFPHRPWLPFLSTEWKRRGSLKKGVCEGENYRSLCHRLLMSWKPVDRIAFAGMVRRTQTLRHGISSMWNVFVQLRHSERKKKRMGEKRKQTNPPRKWSQAGRFSLPARTEAREPSSEGWTGREGRATSRKMTVWSLSVLAAQSLPPQIKGREVAWLSAALSHVKPRRRPYTCSHK